MSEPLGWQFFRTTTGTQSRAAAFDKSRLAMSSLTYLGVTGIFCILRLVLKGRAGKEIPESSR